MRRTTVFLEEDLQRELRALAKRQARPAAALVREAIGQYVVSQKRVKATALSFVGIGRSGRSDVAERHEDFLFTDLDADQVARPKNRGSRRARSSSRR